MIDNLNETRVGNFSHSEKAELRPEFVVLNMGPLGMVVICFFGCSWVCCCWPEAHLRSGTT
jgi:hypothetical protein